MEDYLCEFYKENCPTQDVLVPYGGLLAITLGPVLEGIHA